MVKALLIHNAKVDSKGYLGRTPLSLGLYFNYLINLKFLIFCLLKASENGHVEVVKQLLEHNANIDLTDESEWTQSSSGIFKII